MVISVEETGEVMLYAPFFCKEREIFDFVHEKALWIAQHALRAKRDYQYLQSKSYCDGQEFLFFGKKYPVNIQIADVVRSRIVFDGMTWSISLPQGLSEFERQEEVKARLFDWYKKEAREVLGSRVFYFSRKMEIEPLKVSVRTQKNIWGSCHHTNKTINLNWHLIMTPSMVMDYVIVHEMCHLFVPNHSKRFWKKVEKVMPDYKRSVKWLKENALDMKLP